MAALDPDDFEFIDETSTTLALTRRYARAPRGQRARGQVPRNYGQSTTLFAALSPAGQGAAMTLVGAANTEAFIEHAFSKIKARLRAAAARTQRAPESAIAEALSQVTRRDTHGWFQHCGYPLTAQSP